MGSAMNFESPLALHKLPTLQVLPFRELSQDLVAKLGLRWSPEPCWSGFAKLLRMVRPIDFALWIKLGQKRSLGRQLRMCLIRAGGRTQGNPSCSGHHHQPSIVTE